MPGATPILHLPYPLASEPPDGPAAVKALADALDGQTGGVQGVFIVGEVRFIAVSAAPGGWMLADGRAVSRTAYAALFTALGVLYGVGDGTATFNVPDLRGRSPVGAGAGVGLTSRAAGAKWGAETVTLLAAQSGVNGNGSTGTERQTHTHRVPNQYPADWYPGGGGDLGGPGSYQKNLGAYVENESAPHDHALIARNADAAHENAPPSLAIPAYIYAGV